MGKTALTSKLKKRQYLGHPKVYVFFHLCFVIYDIKSNVILELDTWIMYSASVKDSRTRTYRRRENALVHK